MLILTYLVKQSHKVEFHFDACITFCCLRHLSIRWARAFQFWLRVSILTTCWSVFSCNYSSPDLLSGIMKRSGLTSNSVDPHLQDKMPLRLTQLSTWKKNEGKCVPKDTPVFFYVSISVKIICACHAEGAQLRIVVRWTPKHPERQIWMQAWRI